MSYLSIVCVIIYIIGHAIGASEYAQVSPVPSTGWVKAGITLSIKLRALWG